MEAEYRKMSEVHTYTKKEVKILHTLYTENKKHTRANFLKDIDFDLHENTPEWSSIQRHLIFKMPFKEVPKYMNHMSLELLAQWRLRIGK